MDHTATIAALRKEMAALDVAIAALEKLAAAETAQIIQSKAKDKRGRRSMGAKERDEVSTRMKRYWASRKQRAGQSTSPSIPAKSGHDAQPNDSLKGG